MVSLRVNSQASSVRNVLSMAKLAGSVISLPVER
jgi:hypothetical protein